MSEKLNEMAIKTAEQGGYAFDELLKDESLEIRLSQARMRLSHALSIESDPEPVREAVKKFLRSDLKSDPHQAALNCKDAICEIFEQWGRQGGD